MAGFALTLEVRIVLRSTRNLGVLPRLPTYVWLTLSSPEELHAKAESVRGISPRAADRSVLEVHKCRSVGSYHRYLASKRT
jgi:hypothetical protein